MHILNIKFTSGPNYWSVKKHRLVVMQLDLEELETKPTDQIDCFYERMKKELPGLYKHQCSVGEPGGFFRRVRRGTWMGHVIEHIALELQYMAGMKVGFGRTRGTDTKGQYDVIFECVDEESGRLAAEKAISIARGLIDGTTMNIDKHVQDIRETNLRNMPGPSTASLLREAEARGIPSIKLADSTYQLGYGCYQKKIGATITSSTSTMAVELACDKKACRNRFLEMSIPVAEGGVIDTVSDLKNIIDRIGFPLVVKPVSGNQGRGVMTNIQSWNEVKKAFSSASEISGEVIVERHIPGKDYRLLTVDNKLVAAAKRTPARVNGDGESTIQQLVERVNQDPSRGEGHEKPLTKIMIGVSAKAILSRKDYTLDTVLPDGEILYLDHAANLSKGGTAEDVTDRVHPEVKAIAERISKVVGLDICGIDVMATTLEQPLLETGGVILEVNAAPGFRMHLSPSKGKSRNVAAPVLDMLFPPETKSRIPVIAVTGTNGKTTTTRLISHIMTRCGRNVGSTTTEGIYINGKRIMKGDCGGPRSAELVLKDPTVNTVVFECARGGILREGLGFDRCDVGVVTNVASDHLGINGIDDLSQMARLKSVVPESVRSGGHAVLNADDDRVYAMRKNVRSNCNVVLFCMDPGNPNVKAHCEAGGISVFFDEPQIFIRDGNTTHEIGKAENIPLSFGGRAGFMIENILVAVAAVYTQNIAPADIMESLKSFEPSPEQTPGRMNLFSFETYDVLVDYAHNPAAMTAVKKFIDCSFYRYKTGVVTGIGDRREEDNLEIGRLSAEIFDKVIIREDADLRGKEPGEAIEIIRQGIQRSSYNPEVEVIPDEKEAVLYAMETAKPDSLVVLCVEQVDEVLDMVKQQHASEENSRLHTVKKVRKNGLPAEVKLLHSSIQ